MPNYLHPMPTLRGLFDYHGDRIRWQVGNLHRDLEKEYGQRSVQFGIDVELGAHTGEFDKDKGSWGLRDLYASHSCSVIIWHWGVFLAVRGRQVAA